MNQVYRHERDFDAIEKFSQTQRSLEEQLRDLREVANRLGLYDAADYLRLTLER